MPRGIPRRLIARPRAFLRPAFFALAALVLSGSVAGAELVRAARVWPAQDYTRVTLESAEPLKHSLLVLKNPDRLALDLTDVDLASVQQGLEGKLVPTDPHIAGMRVGQFKPGVVRVVLDLKSRAKPQIFTLPPIGFYGHRLVLDIHPTEPPDPILALLREQQLAQLAGKSRAEVQPEASETDPAIRQPKTTPQAPAPPARRPVMIVIDPGHGGEDPGARGRRGTHEKKVTLAISRKLKALIDTEPGMRALLTRDGDFSVSLADRVDKARVVKADLFVSIHANAVRKPEVRGSMVFALSERATSKTAQSVADRENTADLIAGVNLEGKDRYLKMTLADMSLTTQISDSLKLGRVVLAELGGVNPLHKPNVEQAGFAVLKATSIPSILVETAFISNPAEERRLNDPAYQEKIARAILRGIKSYVGKNPLLSPSTIAALR